MPFNVISAPHGERRGKPRIHVPFPAKVQGVDKNGEPFSVETVLDNLSGRGFYLRMMPFVEEGARLTVVITLSTIATDAGDAPRVRVQGTALRVETKPGGVCGIAATFSHPHFL
ncbi:MAG TPA: PilZ domain-containing protein [Pyrinomonadaceae bacterium]|jgi:hypothetical protein|nr:PilZ domain-containing protein [Pyrinomonadaceae bacterium]